MSSVDMNPPIDEYACTADVVGDRIYHQATLSYIVKGDPKKEVIKLNAFAIIHRNKNNKIYKLEIYNDPAPLMTRVQAVMLGPA